MVAFDGTIMLNWMWFISFFFFFLGGVGVSSLLHITQQRMIEFFVVLGRSSLWKIQVWNWANTVWLKFGFKRDNTMDLKAYKPVGQ